MTDRLYVSLLPNSRSYANIIFGVVERTESASSLPVPAYLVAVIGISTEEIAFVCACDAPDESRHQAIALVPLLVGLVVQQEVLLRRWKLMSGPTVR